MVGKKTSCDGDVYGTDQVQQLACPHWDLQVQQGLFDPSFVHWLVPLGFFAHPEHWLSVVADPQLLAGDTPSAT